MRVNVYAEELSENAELVSVKRESRDGPREHFGVRIYTYLPVTDPETGEQRRGPFIHHRGDESRPADDDSGGVTFWGEPVKLAVVFTAALDATGVNVPPALKKLIAYEQIAQRGLTLNSVLEAFEPAFTEALEKLERAEIEIGQLRERVQMLAKDNHRLIKIIANGEVST